jgi:hypothetical protein
MPTIQLRPSSSVDSLADVAKNVQRVFARSARVIETERAARLGGGGELPDLNGFYVVDGDPARLGRHAGVAQVFDEPAPGEPKVAATGPTDADRAIHDRDARGQGVVIATLARAQDLFDVAPESAVEVCPPPGALPDAIDRAAAELALGDVLFVPYPVVSPAARAACAHAAAGGIVVVAVRLDGEPIPGVLVGPAALAARAACVQSYAVGVGVHRLRPLDLIGLPGFPADPGGALDALEARVAAKPAPRPYAKVVFEKATIIEGGDVGAAEIYFEGWVDDGSGGRRSFRIPHEGHIPNVKDGATITLDTTVYESKRPLGDSLTIHFEAWDEDMGRASLLDPDDLLGAFEKRHTIDERWGEGRHADIRLETDSGAWLLTYSVKLRLE